MKTQFLLFIFCSCCLFTSAQQSGEIDQAMQHYSQLILHGKYDSIAGMFISNGELAGENNASVSGRDSIRKFLKSFQGASVLKYQAQAQTTSFKGDTAIQSGSYLQIVKIPSGDTLELAGEYECAWVRSNGRDWMIKRMYTSHYRNLKEENWLNRLPDNSITKRYGKAIMSEGVKQAGRILDNVMKDTANYYLKENEFNHLGYNLMSKNKEEEALAVFKTYTRLFPNSWNAYDSYGEALLNYGHKKESIKMYRESLKLNPANNNARQVIQKITGQAPKN